MSFFFFFLPPPLPAVAETPPVPWTRTILEGSSGTGRLPTARMRARVTFFGFFGFTFGFTFGFGLIRTVDPRNVARSLSDMWALAPTFPPDQLMSLTMRLLFLCRRRRRLCRRA